MLKNLNFKKVLGILLAVAIVVGLIWGYVWLWRTYFYDMLFWHKALGIAVAFTAALVGILWLYEHFIGWRNTLYWCAAVTRDVAEGNQTLGEPGLSLVTQATLRRRGGGLLFAWIFDTVMLTVLIYGQLDNIWLSLAGSLCIAAAILWMDISLVDPNQPSSRLATAIRICLIVALSLVVGERATQIIFEKNIRQQNMELFAKEKAKIDHKYDDKLSEAKADVAKQRQKVDEATKTLNDEMVDGFEKRSEAKERQLQDERDALARAQADLDRKEASLRDQATDEKTKAEFDFGMQDLVKGAVALHRAADQSFWLWLLVWATRLALVCVSLTVIYQKFIPVREYVEYVKKRTTVIP